MVQLCHDRTGGIHNCNETLLYGFFQFKIFFYQMFIDLLIGFPQSFFGMPFLLVEHFFIRPLTGQQIICPPGEENFHHDRACIRTDIDVVIYDISDLPGFFRCRIDFIADAVSIPHLPCKNQIFTGTDKLSRLFQQTCKHLRKTIFQRIEIIFCGQSIRSRCITIVITIVYVTHMCRIKFIKIQIRQSAVQHPA